MLFCKPLKDQEENNRKAGNIRKRDITKAF